MLLISAASFAIAFPLPNENSQIDKNLAEISYREGKSRSLTHLILYIGPKTDLSSPRYVEVEINSDEALYDLKIVNGPSDLRCRFRLKSNKFFSWIPGQNSRVMADETLTEANPLAGPIKNAEAVVCQTESEYLP